MERERRQNLAFRYCVVAWASHFRGILLISALGFLVALAFTKNDSFLIVAGVLMIGAIIATIVFSCEQAGICCLMCGAHLVSRLRCSPHGNAKKICGSHSLRATFKLASFPALMDCPYCDGHFRLGVKRGDERYRRRERRSATEKSSSKR